MNDKELIRVWNPHEIPVILRRTEKGQLLRLRLPTWLQNGRLISLKSIASERFWEIPKAWFNDAVERALRTYEQIYVIQPYREQEKCSPACLKTSGHECQCSCMGRNYGARNDGSWFEISETFATRWGDQMLACRLMMVRHG